jgi:hypothetical protein
VGRLHGSPVIAPEQVLHGLVHEEGGAAETDDRRIELREFPRPAIGADDGLLRLEACGICGSDVEQFHGAFRDFGLTYPVVPGSGWTARPTRRRSGSSSRGSTRSPGMHTHDLGLADAAQAIQTLAGEIPGEAAIHVAIRPW